jgi:guanylate kinase
MPSATEPQLPRKPSRTQKNGGGGKASTKLVAQAKKAEVRVDREPKPAISTTPLLFVISAPSGGGKTTLCQELLAVRKDITRAITCTTRAPRAGEKDGVDYFFLDAGTFLKRVQAGHFLEHATVYGNSYGTLRSEVLDKLRQGKDVLLNIDVQGAASVRECVKRDEDLSRAFVSVFLTPPSLEILEARLKKRGQDSNDNIRRRISVARQELAQWKHFDYLIISTTIQEDLRRMLAVVEAEKMRQCRVKPPEF